MISALQGFFTLVQTNTTELYIKLFQQMFLVAVSVGFAILIGIPLGILVTRQPRLKKIVLGSAGILQIIPALALLAFLIPFFGIGVKPAIIALFLYALLPIISNTVTGLETVPKASIEAANGLGFTKLQRMWIVELPLALPTIITGIRIATTISVGTATLAAFIGAGGLGDFINRGLALNNTGYLLLGAVPAALLALALDFLIKQIEMVIIKSNRITAKRNYWALGLVAALFILPLISPIVTAYSSVRNKDNTIRIATANFTEQFILGEILKQLIEAKTPLKVKLYSNFGTSEICFQALLNNQIDMYPAYTDLAFLNQLHQPYVGVPRKELFQRAKKAYLEKFNLSWLDPFGFDDAQALGVRNDFSQKHHVFTISELVPIAKRLTIAAPAEFIQRPDGMPGLQQAYHLQFGRVAEMVPTLMYIAILQRKVDVIVAFTTDGRIPAYHLLVLQDDKHLFPPYDCAPLVRMETLKKYPELIPILKLLANAIDDQTMQRLNYEVDLQKKTPAEVAHEFLLKKGLIT